MNIVEAIRKLAAEHPGNVYTRPTPLSSCMYASGICTDGSAGCIVGQASLLCGVSVEELRKFDVERADKAQYMLAYFKLGSRFQHEWARDVQKAQDHGDTWANAVAFADRSIAKAIPTTSSSRNAFMQPALQHTEFEP